MRYAIVRDGVVENLIEWDGAGDWTPPEGAAAHAFPDGAVSISWQWNNGAPIDPNPPMAPVPPPVLTPTEKLAAVGLTVDDLKALLR